MSVCGNVRSQGVPEDAKSCVRAALAMRRELQTLNAKWKREGTAPFRIGVGINYGDVLGGNIRLQEKADPTVIGDAVDIFPGTRKPCVVRKCAILSWLIQWIVQLTPLPPRGFTGYARDPG